MIPWESSHRTHRRFFRWPISVSRRPSSACRFSTSSCSWVCDCITASSVLAISRFTDLASSMFLWCCRDWKNNKKNKIQMKTLVKTPRVREVYKQNRETKGTHYTVRILVTHCQDIGSTVRSLTAKFTGSSDWLCVSKIQLFLPHCVCFWTHIFICSICLEV